MGSYLLASRTVLPLFFSMAKTRPISQRDSKTHSADEVKRRLLFVAYALSIPVALFAFVTSSKRHDTLAAVIGGLAVIAFVFLHFTRSRWGAKDLVEEIARNPFKPKRVPKDSDGEGIL
jgi:amino acid transporter